MRAVIKNGVGVFSPQGFLDGNNSAAFLSLEDIDATVKLNVDMVLVSLKKVIFFNRNGLDAFVKMFIKVREEKHITVGICDFDTRKFDAITKFYKKTSIFHSLILKRLLHSLPQVLKIRTKTYFFIVMTNLNVQPWQ